MGPSANPSTQACLNAPEPAAGNENGVDGPDQVDSPEEAPQPPHMPPQGGPRGAPGPGGMPPGNHPHMPPGGYMPPNMPMDPQQAMAYQNYVQRNQAAYPSGMPQPGMPPNSHQS